MITLPGYQIKETIYQGPRNEVYRAYREADARAVVIKTHRSDFPSARDLSRFQHEFSLGQSLTGDGIIQYYDLVSRPQGLALITEDFGGVELTQVVQPGQINLKQFLQISLKLVQALGQIHQQQIIHKDIKPQNIVISSDGERLKIIDFGLATRLSKENQQLYSPNALVGTLDYISPEQTGRMNRPIDYRTDFYSLGVVLYKLLTGRLPFSEPDSMALVHAHIAKTPIPVHEHIPEIPLVISNIISKLLAKTAEDRYQSIYGLTTDLHLAQNTWLSYRHMEGIALGQYDQSDRFQIPQHLYGRNEDLAVLLQAFSQVSAGSNELVLLTGQAGIGKSALVREVQKPITRQRGYFITGKFDQLQRNTPYSALIQAFQGLIQQLLTENEASIAAWRQRLQTALGPNAQIIGDVIPELALIIEPRTAITPLGPTETQNRFNLVFQNFIRVFTQQNQPLVMFIDDLQWADAASLRFLQNLLITADIGYFMFIGAYRDNEVDTIHPLKLTLNALAEASIIPTHIALKPLTLSQTSQLIADSLTSDPAEVRPLAELVLQKTDGNPFFLNQFLISLYEAGLIKFVQPNVADRKPGGWQWDFTQIQAQNITDNVVELVADSIQKLAPSTQEILKLAACIGSQFDQQTLAIIGNTPFVEVPQSIEPAIESGLILPISTWQQSISSEDQTVSNSGTHIYKFLHDRVQQAAYSLIPQTETAAIHRQIGQLLLQSTAAVGRDEAIFDIVNHLNFGLDLITNETEREDLSQLNLQAGKKAKATSAYATALKYLQTSLHLLTPAQTYWQSQPELMLNLHVEAAEAAYLQADFAEMERLSTVVLSNTESLIDQVKIYEVKLQAYTAKNQMLEAVQTAREILALLGITLPKKANQAHIIRGLLGTKLALGRRKPTDLKNLPAMQDTQARATVRILTNTAAPAYIAAPNLFPLVVFNIVNLSVKHGNMAESAFGYANYGLILAGALGDIRNGYAFGQLAVVLMKQFEAKALAAKISTVVDGFVRHWQEPLTAALPDLQKGYQMGLEVGDIEYAMNCALMYGYNAFSADVELPILEPEIRDYSNAMQKFGQGRTLRANQLRHLLILCLMGQTNDPLTLSKGSLTEADILAEIVDGNDRSELCVFHTAKAMLAYLFASYETAITHIEIAAKNVDAVPGQMIGPTQNLYHSLTYLAHYLQVDKRTQKKYLKQVAVNQKKLKKWAKHAPANFADKYALVAAEQAVILDQPYQAMALFDQAIELAEVNQFWQIGALANERAAQFYTSRRQPILAQSYYDRARSHYRRWGAGAKANHLTVNNKAYLGEGVPEDPSENKLSFTGRSALSTSISSDHNGDLLDLATVMKAAQTISGEMVLDNLLEKMTEIMLQNAGAEKCYLILDKNGDWVIEAKAVTSPKHHEAADSPDIIITRQTMPLETSADIAQGIVNFVSRTGQSVVLGDAANEGIFSNDPYVVQNRPKSILCAPIRKQTQLLGMLYLENNLTTNAFPADRLQVLELLSAQVAISLENAQFLQEMRALNTDLQQEVRERKRAEEMVRRSEAHFRALIEHASDITTVLDTEGALSYVSPSIERVLGYEPEELIQRNAFELAHPDDLAKVLEIFNNTQDEINSIDFRYRHKDQSWRILEAVGRNLSDNDDVGGVVVNARDVTERKQVEQELANYREHLEDLVEARTIELQAANQQLLNLNTQLQNELTLAQRIQQSLLPHPQPSWPGSDLIFYNDAAQDMGGDFYAYHQLDATKFAVAVGDVSGKGMSAALMMAVSLALYQATIDKVHSPSGRLMQLSLALAPYTQTTHLNCAMCYVELETSVAYSQRTQTLTIVNAGCIPPLIRRTNGSVEWVDAGGAPLGTELSSLLGYKAVSLKLNEGDLVILTSDGVVEANQQTDQIFGFDQLEATVSQGPSDNAKAMLTHIRQAVADFVGSAQPHDDITIAVLRA